MKLDLMKVVRMKDKVYLENKKKRVEINDAHSFSINEDSIWLVDNNYNLLVQSANTQMYVHQNDQIYKYEMDMPPEVYEGEYAKLDYSKDNVQYSKDQGKDEMSDLSEVKEALKHVHSLAEEYHTISTGKNVAIKCSLKNGSIIKECSEYGLVSISPVTIESLRSIISNTDKVEYDAKNSILVFGANNNVQIPQQHLIEVFDDVYIQATERNGLVQGQVRSDKISNSPVIVLGRHVGRYQICPIDDSVVIPSLNWEVDKSVQYITKYSMQPVDYETFRDCVKEYLLMRNDLSMRQLEALVEKDYTNLDGKPVCLNVLDKLELKQMLCKNYQENQMEESISMHMNKR